MAVCVVKIARTIRLSEMTTIIHLQVPVMVNSDLLGLS